MENKLIENILKEGVKMSWNELITYIMKNNKGLIKIKSDVKGHEDTIYVFKLIPSLNKDFLYDRVEWYYENKNGKSKIYKAISLSSALSGRGFTKQNVLNSL